MAAQPLQAEWQNTKLKVSKAGELLVTAEGSRAGRFMPGSNEARHGTEQAHSGFGYMHGWWGSEGYRWAKSQGP